MVAGTERWYEVLKGMDESTVPPETADEMRSSLSLSLLSLALLSAIYTV
jgi:hypothetical protein